MRKTCPPVRLGAALVVLGLAVAGCQQIDQELPFELAEGEGAALTIGPSGGTLSVPPSFSLGFPAGSLPTSVSVEASRLITEPFPSDAGAPVPGTAYDIAVPAGTVLSSPAHVELAVDPALLELGDEARLVVAVVRENGMVATFTGTYDLTNGVLTADIDVIGDLAAVVSADAIPIGLDAPPALGGGSVPLPGSPAPSGAALSSHGGVEFTAACSPDARQCFSSGLIRLWADQVVRDRMGDRLFLLDPTIQASLDFVSFDVNGVPTEVVGSLRVGGQVRARFNSYVSSYELLEGVTTGPGTTPAPTGLQVNGNVMIIEQTTDSENLVEFNEELEFGITGIGTSEMLLISVEAEVEFDNSDGSSTIGAITAHVRLRR